MLARGLGAACLLLVWAAAAGTGAAALQPAGTCGPTFEQNDAGSGLDAGADQPSAVSLPEEDHYRGTIGAPAESGMDLEDWFVAEWSDQGERRVMVNVSTAPGLLAYQPEDRVPAPHLEVAAYAPGEAEPTHEGEIQDDGTVSLEFLADGPGTWFFQVSFASAPVSLGCQTTQGADAPHAQTYQMYWGCHPHCMQSAA